METRITNLEALEQEAVALVGRLTPLAHATLITLSGELGAGKTTFSQALARALGVDGVVTSPTFVLEKLYPLPENSVFSRLIHIDAYRLKDGKDLEQLTFTALMEEPHNIVILEWPERVIDALPVATFALRIEINDDGTRTFIYG